MSEPFRRIELANGLQLELFDQSNRYFGDYHRVRLLVRCSVPVRTEWLLNLPAELPPEQARALLGEAAVFERQLEQMGVPSAELERVKEQLVGGFLAATGPYLGAAEFPGKFLLQQLRARRQGPRRFGPLSS